MPASEDRAISDFPIALQLLNTAIVLISNPDGLGGYDSVQATLIEVGRVILETQYTQDLGNVDVFNAIKNCRVLSGTSNPSSSQGVDGQIYVKYQTVANVDTVTGLYVKLNSAWVEIATGGGGGAPVLYGTTDPTSAQGSDGQLYMKYEYVTGCEVEVTVYKATDGRTVSITITENGSTVYSATPACDIMGEYAEVSTTITLSTGTYSLKHWGVHEDVADVESQFVEIDGHQIGFIADGINSSYTVNGTETVEVEYGGDIVIATWLKKSTEWIPVDDSGAVIDDSTPSVKKVYSSAKVEDLLSDKADASTTYTKTEVDTALSAKANNSDITTINSLLNGYSFDSYILEGNGALLTLPSYNDTCIIFIARGGSGLYVGHWTGVTSLINDSNFQINYYSNPSRINVINNGPMTAKITVIRK